MVLESRGCGMWWLLWFQEIQVKRHNKMAAFDAFFGAFLAGSAVTW